MHAPTFLLHCGVGVVVHGGDVLGKRHAEADWDIVEVHSVFPFVFGKRIATGASTLAMTQMIDRCCDYRKTCHSEPALAGVGIRSLFTLLRPACFQ